MSVQEINHNFVQAVGDDLLDPSEVQSFVYQVDDYFD